MPPEAGEDKSPSRRLGAMLCLGFSSGLPLALTSSTLQAWLTVQGVDVRTLGLLSLVGLPYALKFLWSPLIDRYALPWLGRRRDWMLLAQLLLGAAVAAMAFWRPASGVGLVAALAWTVAFLSASQDVAYDAYRTEVLPARERGLGTGLSVSGYRLAMLASGAGALLLAERVGWRETYLAMAALMGVGVAGTVWAPPLPGGVGAPRTVRAAILEPFARYLERQGALALAALVLLYKLGDAFAGALSTSFLIRGLGFSVGEVGLVNKGAGLLATLAGALLGGALMTRMRLHRALLAFGALQALTNLGFYALTWLGKSHLAMTAVVVLENLAGGMGTCALVALLMALCEARYAATQFALLSALASVGRVAGGAPAGFVVHEAGWGPFYLLSIAVALPGLVLVVVFREALAALDAQRPACA